VRVRVSSLLSPSQWNATLFKQEYSYGVERVIDDIGLPPLNQVKNGFSVMKGRMPALEPVELAGALYIHQIRETRILSD